MVNCAITVVIYWTIPSQPVVEKIQPPILDALFFQYSSYSGISQHRPPENFRLTRDDTRFPPFIFFVAPHVDMHVGDDFGQLELA